MNIQEIHLIGIVGAGTMGSRIALRCVLSGKDVNIYHRLPQRLAQVKKENAAWLEQRVNDGRLTVEQAQSALNRLQLFTRLEKCLAEADLVIETVPENLELKRQVFAEIDQLAPSHALIATNSSSIPCSRIASITNRSHKVFNINFSDPSDDHDKLVELMGSEGTSKETLLAGEHFVLSLKMVPIVTKREIMGFAFNRIWRAIKKEALFLVGNGYAEFEDIDRAWMLEFGTPFGPFGLMDRVGLDVIYDIEMQYYLETGDESDKPPQFLKDFITQGRKGVKSGKGFYTYPEPVYQQPAWLYKKTNLDF